ncbi:MAG: ABC transporter ATP-binding protein [bacterium]|jgi:ATP-binding cassette subfamily B multidrug efflux pump
MKELASLYKYFWKYKWRFSLGVIFIILSNYFGILAPQVTGFVVDEVQIAFNPSAVSTKKVFFDPLVNWWIDYFKSLQLDFSTLVMFCGLMLLSIALLRGFFMFLMRQTIIVMSRHIEYDQKNEVYAHYQQLDLQFYKQHSTGDLMSRMSEDVSRVRMFTGPALMYLVNLSTLIAISLFYMFRKDPQLAAYVLSPLPFLAIGMYFVNAYINKKSEKIQEQLSEITTIAQESYSGIRVIKSYSQEKSSLGFFENESEGYRKSAMGLSIVESIYFPAIGLLIGLSTLLTIYIGSIYQLEHRISAGTIAEFVVYINMLTFPVSAIGWVASNTQRAAASQKRLNEFLQTNPVIQDDLLSAKIDSIDDISFNAVDFIYPHTGIHAVKSFNLHIKRGQKVALIGKTGCGKSTIAQLLLRMYDPASGSILINGVDLRRITLNSLRSLISYVPQDVFLFSDTIKNNINFGNGDDDLKAARIAAEKAVILHEIESLSDGFNTLVGERGVTLSGGQKQRISIARALSKRSDLLIFDDCLSAVDAKTEHAIAEMLNQFLIDRTALVITHRIFPAFIFDQIIVMDDGQIIEHGTHQELIQQGGYYARLLNSQAEDSTNI